MMFYYYLRIFNWCSSVFGLHNPFPVEPGKVQNTRWFKLWSLIVSSLFVASYFYINDFWSVVTIKTHLDEIASANNLIVNVIIILVNLYNGESVCLQIYAVINSLIHTLQIKNENQKLLAIKIYMWMTPPFVTLVVLIVMEFIYANPPYTLVVKMPILLSTLHLFIHLSFLLAVLKVVNLKIFKWFKLYDNFLPQDLPKTKRKLHYLICPTIDFFEVKTTKARVNLYSLCEVYDNIGICITLLEKNHGVQILLSIWLMFSNAVTGTALITADRANLDWVVIVRSALPFFWYYMGCYVDNQLRLEVEQTDMLIIKHLIDFRCDQKTKEVLQTFRQVVSANRLEFTAAGLFRLNYATMLGTVVNVITYSIILIQVLY